MARLLRRCYACSGCSSTSWLTMWPAARPHGCGRNVLHCRVGGDVPQLVAGQVRALGGGAGWLSAVCTASALQRHGVLPHGITNCSTGVRKRLHRRL